MKTRKTVLKCFSWIPLVVTALAITPVSHANLIFSYDQVGTDVVMTSSGTVNLNNLVQSGSDGWGGTGWGNFDGFSLIGGTSFGQNDTTFIFNNGTDLSPWATSVGIFDFNFFSPDAIAGSKSFATFAFVPEIVPGLSIRAADIISSTWTTDQVWTYNNQTLASLGLNVGSYSIVDAVSGETFTIRIGIVPEPSTLALLGIGLVGLGFARRRRIS